MNYYIQFTEITLKTVVLEKLVETPFFFLSKPQTQPAGIGGGALGF
jgi:hypothetical protein